MLNDDDNPGLPPALDPEDASRLNGERITGHFTNPIGGESIKGPVDAHSGAAFQAATSSRLLVPTSDGNIYLPCEGIVRLEAEGSYTHIHTLEGEHHLTCKGIGVLHQQLPGAWFHRCHRAHVINLMKVRKLLRTGGHRAELLTGDMVEASRRNWRTLLAAMSALRSR